MLRRRPKREEQMRKTRKLRFSAATAFMALFAALLLAPAGGQASAQDGGEKAAPQGGDEAASAQSGGGKAPPCALSLKGGKLLINGEESGAEVKGVESRVKGPVRFYSAYENEPGDGVGFFSESGGCLASLPLESALGLQGLQFSPGEEFLLMQFGSEMRPDATYKLLDGGSFNEIAEIAGIAGSAVWIDGGRFVLTRIDGVREGAGGEVQPLIFKTSVVLCEAPRLTYSAICSADALTSCWLDQAGESSAFIRKETVASEGDWGDEEKATTSNVYVGIPPAE
jgi:hypothetical protein